MQPRTNSDRHGHRRRLTPRDLCPASGSTFPYGTTTVSSAGATDSHGNTPPGAPFRSPWTTRTRRPSPSPAVSPSRRRPEGSVVSFPGPANASDDKDGGLRLLEAWLRKHISSARRPCVQRDGPRRKRWLGTVRRHGRGHDPPIVTPPFDLWTQTMDESVSRAQSDRYVPRRCHRRGHRRPERRDHQRRADVASRRVSTTVTFIGRTTLATRRRNGDRDGLARPRPAEQPGPDAAGERLGRRRAHRRPERDLQLEEPVRRGLRPRRLSREPGAGGAAPSVVYEGPKGGYKDTGLQVGTQYRYLLVTYDKSGNRSAGSRSSSSDASNSSSPPPTGRRSQSRRR